MIFIWSIRRCQIPIGRAKTKNWNLWLCYIKQRSGKKVDKILCWWYRDWWQSIRGMTREVLKCFLLLYESKEWPKKGTRRPTKTAKNTKIVIFGQKKSACGKPPAEENGPFPRETLFGTKKKRLRQAANRGKWSCSWRSASRQKFKQKSRKKRGGVPMIWPFYDQNRMKIVSSALTFRDGSF